jgi:hypothetical protein
MSQQLTFADSEFSSKRRQTCKELFLSRMDNLLPWPQLLEVIDPFILNQAMADVRTRLRPCFAFIV